MSGAVVWPLWRRAPVRTDFDDLSNGDPPQANSLGEFIGQRLPFA
jgi:hypothetical protein